MPRGDVDLQYSPALADHDDCVRFAVVYLGEASSARIPKTIAD